MSKIRAPIERFEEKYIPEPNSGCWLWTAAINNQNYGLFYSGVKLVLAHRFSYEEHIGPIGGDKHILHSCDNTFCVNPSHLRQGTQYENMRDKVWKGRQNRGVDSPHTSLTEEDVRVIKFLVNKGTITYKNIGKIFCVDRRVVNNIANGDTWKHVI